MQLEQQTVPSKIVACEVRSVVGRRVDFHPSHWEELGRFRYEIFVRQLGWNLRCARYGIEEDQFDTDQTLYVRANGLDGAICGCARLLPTTRPYLLDEVFPQLLRAGRAPRSASTWELSRFAVARGEPGRVGGLVFRQALETARDHGAVRVVGVLSCALERVCKGYGFRLERLGDPMTIEGMRLVACAVQLMDVDRPALDS